jgi:hypothetical protein
LMIFYSVVVAFFSSSFYFFLCLSLSLSSSSFIICSLFIPFPLVYSIFSILSSSLFFPYHYPYCHFFSSLNVWLCFMGFFQMYFWNIKTKGHLYQLGLYVAICNVKFKTIVM